MLLLDQIFLRFQKESYEKLQYDNNKEAAKISPLPSGKIDKYKYLTGEEILLSDQGRAIKQTKFTYSPLWKTFEKRTKRIEEEGREHVAAIKEHEKQLVKSNAFTEKEKSITMNKQKEIFYNLIAERTGKIEKLYKL